MSAINVRLENSSSTRTVAWMMWAVASIFFGYQYILRVMPSIMMHDIMQHFNIDIRTFGQFSGIYYIGYAIMHLPIGIALDRYGPKKIMAICILLTVTGLLPIVFAEHWQYLLLGRLLIGIGSSAAILSTFKIIHLNFKADQFTRMLSFSVMIGLMCAIYGGGSVNYMCNTLGYQNVTLIFACIGTLLSIMAYVLLPEIKMHSTSSISSNIKDVFRSKKIMAVCCLAGLMVGPLEGFADAWGKEFLLQTYGLEDTLAATLPSAIFLGACFGGPILSYIAGKIKSDLFTIFAAGILMATCFTILIMGKASTSSISIMFIAIGVCCTYQTLAIYKASTYVKAEIVGLTTAVANMIIMIFGYVFHSIIGVVISLCGGKTSVTAFKLGMAIIPAALLIGALGFMLMYWQEHRANKLSMNV